MVLKVVHLIALQVLLLKNAYSSTEVGMDAAPLTVNRNARS